MLCYVWISYIADQRQVWKRQYMSMALIKVILIPLGQSCLLFVYFENLWEVNTPCAQRLRQTTGVWYQAELKLCQHIQSLRLTLQRPPVVSYLRHRHTVSYIAHTLADIHCSPCLFPKYIFVLKFKWVFCCLLRGHVCLVYNAQRLESAARYYLLMESN